jgi:ribonuclease Z
VTHTDTSCAVRLEVDNISFVFSGDRYAWGLSIDDLGPCDILLHEGTFKSDQSKAKERLHSTFDTAITEGAKMKAKFIILTHFSLRNKPKDYQSDEKNVMFGIDYLTIPFNISVEEFYELKEKIESVVTNFL